MIRLSTDPGSNKSSIALELMSCAGSSVHFFQAISDTVETNGYADFYSPWINGERIKDFFFFPNKIDGGIKSITLLRFYHVQDCPGQWLLLSRYLSPLKCSAAAFL